MQGSKLAKDPSRWNAVTLGDSIYTVERAPELLAKIDLSTITSTNAYEKFEHKAQCRNCKMYFEKSSVSTYLPNHRVVDWQRNHGLVIEGARYSTASYLYTNCSVCTFCEQLFSAVGPAKVLPKPKKRAQKMSNSASAASLSGLGSPSVTSASLFDDNASIGGDSVATFATSDSASSYGRSGAIKNNRSNDNNIDTVVNMNNGPKLQIITPMRRTNIAVEKRAYQSSEVDHMGPENAITVPYHKASRSRREADPWWEVDLGQPYHAHSITFDVMAQKAQAIEAHVILMSKPYGFEEPFLDKVARKGIARQEFQIDEVPSKKFQRIEWILPPGVQPVAIRIQLRGINTLQISEFKVYLGDNFVINDEVKNLRVTKESFATVSPIKIKNSLESMLSEGKKREMTSAKLKKMIKPSFDLSQYNVQQTMGKLDSAVYTAYARQRAWKQQTLSFIEGGIFTRDLLHELYHTIWKPSVIEGCKATERTHPYNNLALGAKYTDDSSLKIPEDDLFDAALILHYPRAELSDIRTRLRSALLMIQSFGSHPKPSWVGELQYCPPLVKLAQDPNERLILFKNALDVMETHWEESAKKYRDKNGNPRKGKTDPAIERGCSWSQFLIIFSLFMDKRMDMIPELAFNVDSPLKERSLASKSGSKYNSRPATAERPNTKGTDTRPGTKGDVSRSSTSGGNISRANTAQDGNHMNSKIDSAGMDFDALMNTKPKIVTSSDGTSGALIPYDGSLYVVEGVKSTDYGSIGFAGGVMEANNNDTPLLMLARDPAIPPMDTRFSEYKLGNFSKRVNAEFVFPKELSLDFTAMMLKDQKARAAGKKPVIVPKRRDDDEDSLDGSMSFVDSQSVEEGPSLIVPSFEKVEVTPEKKVQMTADDYGAPRTCTLCQKRYAYSATHFKILFKHIITLRRHWDPALVSKDVQMLEQGTSMFNLVTVCGFCNQLFDPDFAGGIFFPIRKSGKSTYVGMVPDADAGSVRENPFFDGRYPVKKPSGSLFHDVESEDARRLAKSAIVFAERLKKQRLEDDERAKLSEALAGEGSPNSKSEV